MDTRTVNGFRVRCAVISDAERRFQVQVWTRKVGGNAPEKCWPMPGGRAFASQAEAERTCQTLFQGIRGVRFNGEPEYPRLS